MEISSKKGRFQNLCRKKSVTSGTFFFSNNFATDTSRQISQKKFQKKKIRSKVKQILIKKSHQKIFQVLTTLMTKKNMMKSAMKKLTSILMFPKKVGSRIYYSKIEFLVDLNQNFCVSMKKIALNHLGPIKINF